MQKRNRLYKFRWLVVLPVIFIFCMSAGIAYAQDNENQTNGNPPDVNELYEDIYEELDLAGIERSLSEAGIDTVVPFHELVKSQIQGNNSSILQAVFSGVWKLLANELGTNKQLMLELVGIVLIGSIFVNLAGSFAGGFVSENGFYITYMIMTSMLLSSFSMALAITTAALDKVLVAVRILVPAFVLVLQFVGHATTAGGTYSVVLVGMWFVQVVIVRVVLPLIDFFVILSLVNNLQKDDSFSKLCELVYSIVKWLLRTIIVVVVGLNIIKGLLEPQMDLLGKTAAKRILTAIPGGAVSVLASTYLAAGMVIKNTIGISGILILSVLCLFPLIKLFLIMFTIRITSAVIQPMGDKRFVDGTGALAQGVSLLMQTLASSLVLFVITLALMATATNTGGM